MSWARRNGGYTGKIMAGRCKDLFGIIHIVSFFKIPVPAHGELISSLYSIHSRVLLQSQVELLLRSRIPKDLKNDDSSCEIYPYPENE